MGFVHNYQLKEEKNQKKKVLKHHNFLDQENILKEMTKPQLFEKTN